MFYTTRRLNCLLFPYCIMLFHASCFIHAVSSFVMGPFPWTWKTYPLKPSSDVTTSKKSSLLIPTLCIVILGRIPSRIPYCFCRGLINPPSASPQQFLCASFYIALIILHDDPFIYISLFTTSWVPRGQNCLLFVSMLLCMEMNKCL